MSLAKSAVDFKHIFGGVFGGDAGGGIGRCVFGDMDDGEARVDVDDVERQRGVFHPKAEQGFLRENKEHTAERRQFVAIHEAELTFFLRVRNFDCDVDGVPALRVDDDLGRRGGRERAGEKKKGDEKEQGIPPRPIPLRERVVSLKRKSLQRSIT